MGYSVLKMKNIENKSNDRILELSVPEGQSARSTQGLLDNRILKGTVNRLHAVQESGLWYLKYDAGNVPPALKQRYTNFNVLMKHVTTYFKRRNIDVKEVL